MRLSKFSLRRRVAGAIKDSRSCFNGRTGTLKRLTAEATSARCEMSKIMRRFFIFFFRDDFSSSGRAEFN